MPMSANAVPCATAEAARTSRSDFSPRACRFVQTIIHVTVPTATRPTMASNPSCCFCGSPRSKACSAIPPARHSPAATTTPSHIQRRSRRFPERFKNAATIPTMSAASTPSLSPMMNVGITGAALL